MTTIRGISSSGRAPASHAGGTGIDTQILQFLFALETAILTTHQGLSIVVMIGEKILKCNHSTVKNFQDQCVRGFCRFALISKIYS